VAVILSGTGVQDGSEVTEAVSFMIALSANNVKFQCFAPNKDQHEVINHLTGEKTTEKRNMLVESARIARGEVKDLAELKVEEFHGVVLPGGFGVAKNLSNYASAKDKFTIDPTVE